MKKIFKSRMFRRSIIILGASIISMFVVVGVTLATTTPQRCDPTPKYYCSQVTYTDQGSNVLITARAFRGAIDGGADQWQNWYTKDWERVSGSWSWRESWGPTAWRSDITLSQWFGFQNDDRTRIKDSCVTVKMRFQEAGEYWCSGRIEHYMINNTSTEILPANCNL